MNKLTENGKMSKGIKITIPVLVGLLLMGGMVAANTVINNAPTIIGPSPAQQNKLIPAAQQPTPVGFTQEQIQKAKQIIIKETANATNNTSTGLNKGVNSQITIQNFDGMFVIRPPIDSQYNDNSYQRCYSWGCYTIYPSLYIPLKTEVWNDNYSPAQNAYVQYTIYYWNYYTQNWQYWNYANGYTNSNGQINLGSIIPYKTYSDKYLIYSYVSMGGRFQSYQNYFTVYWN